MSDSSNQLTGTHGLPRSLGRLEDLAGNLWWSWNLDARRLFESIDPTLWRLIRHNPVKLLNDVRPDRFLALAQDPLFIRSYEAVLKTFDVYMSAGDTWFATREPGFKGKQIAYFSSEFGLHNSISIYSGGLGILAGDHCKEASDLGIPLVGVGFMYPQGYFQQRISTDGWQIPMNEESNREDSPVKKALLPNGEQCRISVKVGPRNVVALVWKVQVGRVVLYLLDTNISENQPADRELLARLYGGNHETRLCQEILLGIGGVRALRALGLSPSVFHANEGHSAFLTLERVRELFQSGMSHDQATELVRRSTVFTTHTPVPAGHDVFSHELMDRYFTGYWDELGLSRESFLNLGAHPEAGSHGFNMTVLAIRMSAHLNGVSREHGRVSRAMWSCLWPGLSHDQVPIRSITNGIHVPTWISPEMFQLFAKYLGPDWTNKIDDPALWQRISEVPDSEIWAVRQTVKRKLMGFIRERARTDWMHGQLEPIQALASGTLLDPDALTLGFARRFATYKRATLMFKDLDRLKAILLDSRRPVQIVFAGKAHPADEPGRYFIHQIYNFCKEQGLGGRIAFLKDYDMHMAKFLVQGVDIWMNTPRAPMEASGTSGEKAAFNGVPHFSVLDGWWEEGYDGSNGWAIPVSTGQDDPHLQDAHDAEHLYRLLEQEVVPLYYQRDRDGIPRGWVQIVKEAIRTAGPRFCMRRMLKEYVEHLYLPAASRHYAGW